MPSPETRLYGSRCSSAGVPGAGGTTFEGTPFVFGQSTPDPCILAVLHGPSQAGLHDLTATADDLCLFGLTKRGPSVPDRKEKLGVIVQADRIVSPSHRNRAPTVEVLELGILQVNCGALFGVTVLLGVTLIMRKSKLSIAIVKTSPLLTPVRNRWRIEASE